MAHQMPFMSISGDTCKALGVSSPCGLNRNVTLSPLRFALEGSELSVTAQVCRRDAEVCIMR